MYRRSLTAKENFNTFPAVRLSPREPRSVAMGDHFQKLNHARAQPLLRRAFPFEDASMDQDAMTASEPGEDDDYTLGGLLRRHAPEAAARMGLGPTRAGSVPNPYAAISIHSEREIKADGRHRWLGYFNTPEEAHAAYVAAASRLFGDFARVA